MRNSDDLVCSSSPRRPGVTSGRSSPQTPSQGNSSMFPQRNENDSKSAKGKVWPSTLMKLSLDKLWSAAKVKFLAGELGRVIPDRQQALLSAPIVKLVGMNKKLLVAEWPRPVPAYIEQCFITEHGYLGPAPRCSII